MNPEPRYVFDNNAVVSAALFSESVPAQALYAALEHGTLMISAATLTELRDVLARKKFDRYLTRDERDEFLAMLVEEGEVVEIVEEIDACRDRKDNKFLDVAVNGAASCLVSGDQDLLVLHPFRGIPILAPAQFLAGLPHDTT